MQQPQPLGRNLSIKKIDAGRVAARAGKAGDETHRHCIFADSEDDRDCCGRSFGRKRGRIAPERGNYRHATADEVGHERWQAIVLALQPMVLDRRVLALDVAGFVESFTERSDLAHRGIRRPATDEANDRDRRLLRARRKRHAAAAPNSMMKSRRLMGLTPKDKDHELTITGQPVHRSKGWPLMSALGHVWTAPD